MTGDPTPLLDRVSRLAFPRFPGTEAERRAADLVAAELSEAGLEVTREPFRASPRAVARLRAIVHGGVAAGAVGLALASTAPLVSAALGMALLALLPSASRWRRGIEGMFDAGPQIESRNVIGRRSTVGEPAAGGGPVVVLLAHVDSKSAALPTFVPVVTILVAMGVILAATALAAVRAVGYPAPVLPAPLLLAAAVAVALLPLIPVGNRSPGAMDNASGVAVLVELARTLPRDPALASTELVFLATGAEEIGLCGAMRWIQRHEAELDRERTAIINLDSVGVGDGLLAIDVRGRCGGRDMAALVDEAARRAGGRFRRLPFLPGVGVDSMPFGARGFATVSLLGRVLGEASRRIHGPRDTIDLLDEAALRHAAAVAGELTRVVAKTAPEGRKRPGRT
jgi:hypothetical protein